jgi:hypothetical protein
MLTHHLHDRPNLRTGGGTIATPWLFPGYRPGKHLDAQSIMLWLRKLGIDLLGARKSALGNFVAQVPLPSSPNCSATATASASDTPNSPPRYVTRKCRCRCRHDRLCHPRCRTDEAVSTNAG